MRSVVKISKSELQVHCDGGKSYRTIGSIMGVSESTIRNYVSKYKIKKVKPLIGRPRCVSKRVGDILSRKYTACEFLSARDGINYIREVSDIMVSKQTVIRELKSRQITCKVRQKKPNMTISQLKKRKKFHEVHKNFDYQDFRNYIFSDESTFEVKGTSKQKTFFAKKKALAPKKSYRRTIKFGGGSVMVWGYITFQGVGKICRVDGHVNSTKYCKILEDTFLDGITDQGVRLAETVFVQDNAPCHTSIQTKRWLREQHVSVLEWPPNSPDMNIIENVWEVLDQAVRARDDEINSKDSLFQIIEQEWYKIDSSYIRRLYKSLPRRISALKEAKYDVTKY